MAGTLGRDHEDVDVLGSLDAAVMDIEAVAEHEGLAGLEVRRHVAAVHRRLNCVGDEQLDDVAFRGGFGGADGREAVFLREVEVDRAGKLAHEHLDPRVAEVQGLGMALRTIPDDRDGLARQMREVGILLEVHSSGHEHLLMDWRWATPSRRSGDARTRARDCQG